ncbi:ketopantoate reductase family protein [Streptomyces lunaelactis]|uniref:ketopantoate reductase family protein n=1 Tax=Streptomyces lunaelactis TaxID=1535768 RepID=UPI00158522F7|nr:ketopantoate reductase family protein [Streptomyces lunaelactis]NUJ99588.1 ketopantoate reductase family protein [Streptomyces lunaelactis]NUK14312.1 ketopantoate reductase family protein [Streptomyces lunaelactis]
MRILVVGAGATGGYFGARLAEAGQDVTFLVRPQRAAILRERGLRITCLGEETVITPRLATAAELSAPYDLVLLSVKATALGQAIDDVAPAIGPQTAIVPFLNGMAHLETLNARFGAQPVLGGVAKLVTTLNADGDIVRLAPLATLTIGEQDGRPSARVDKIHSLLDDAGIDVSASADIVGAMWHKWVFITTVGALTCLMRGTVGDVVATPGGSGLGPAILAEAAAVSAAAGSPVPDDQLAAITATVTQAGSPFAPSMYRDVAHERPTEVEHVFADLVTRARTLSVGTPLLDLATLHLRVHQHRTADRALEHLGG